MARRHPGAGAAAAAAAPPGLPSGGRLLRPFGCFDDHGDQWHWLPGAVVRNPYVVGLLLSRQAPVEPVE